MDIDRVIPRADSVSETGDRVSLDRAVTLVTDGSEAATAATPRVRSVLSSLDLDVRLAETDADEAATGTSGTTLTLLRDERVETGAGPGAYRLSVAPDGIELGAPTRTGLHYGAQTLWGAADRPRDRDGNEGPAGSDTGDGNGRGPVTLPVCEVTDRPAYPWRGLMLDPARGHIPAERVETLVDAAARAKLNRLQFHLIDTETYALESTAYPDLSTGETYDPTDVDDLVDYAADRDVTLVPEFDVPGHATHLIETVPEVQCAGDDPSDYTVCAGAEETYEVLETLLAEVVDQFPGEYVHVGGDEWALNVSWDDCPVCQARIEREGLDGLQGLFQYFLRRLHGILDDFDRRMVVWNDMIDVSTAPDIPRDTVVQFWTVSDPDRDWDVPVPVEGCSMQRFLAEGFDVVNSYCQATYVTTGLERALAREWTPGQFPTSDGDGGTAGSGDGDGSGGGRETAGDLLGSQIPAWNGWKDDSWRALQRRALPSAVAVLGDRMWRDEAPETAPGRRDGSETDWSFGQDLTRHVLGPHVPDGFDLFGEFGGALLPPDVDERADAYASLSGRSAERAVADYRRARGTLADMVEEAAVVDEDAAQAYLDTLDWLIEVAQREGRGLYARP